MFVLKEKVVMNSLDIWRTLLLTKSLGLGLDSRNRVTLIKIFLLKLANYKPSAPKNISIWVYINFIVFNCDVMHFRVDRVDKDSVRNPYDI